jgi:hypothetical protein
VVYGNIEVNDSLFLSPLLFVIYVQNTGYQTYLVGLQHIFKSNKSLICCRFLLFYGMLAIKRQAFTVLRIGLT